MTRASEMAKEAICSALYGMTFTRFLGEVPDSTVQSDRAWFRLSNTPERERVNWRQDPHYLMVSVFEDVMDLVTVTCECINLSGGADSPLRASVTYRIPTKDVPEPTLKQATEQVVVQVLETFKDVLADRGIAGPLEDAMPESAAGDEDDEDDMAVKD